MVYDAAGDEQAFAKMAAQVKRAQEAYKNYCREVGRTPRQNRTQVDGYDRSMSQRATQTYENYLKDYQKIVIIKKKGTRLVKGTYSTSNEEIKTILENELSGINFTLEPKYNSRIAGPGKTRIIEDAYGRRKIASIEIGKQFKSTKEALIDTLIHEELEARIALRKNAHYEYLDNLSENERHKYINSLIERYFKLKGWDYGLV